MVPYVIIGDASCDVTHMDLEITHNLVDMAYDPGDFVASEFSASFSMNYETTDALLPPGSVFTVQISIDHNPWHRKTEWSVSKIRDGISWTFRKRVLRRDLIDTTVVTIPNCKYEWVSDRL